MWTLTATPWKRIVTLVLLVAFAGLFLSACSTVDPGEQSRETAVDQRWENFNRGQAKYPAPTNIHNFPIRQALVKFTERQDLINHPWYTYLISPAGPVIGYFVTQTYPISTCNFLSSTEDIRGRGDTGIAITTAPSYDAIFYGGGGASSACQDQFFFDAATDLMYTYGGPVIHFTSDGPITLYADAPRIEGAKVSDQP